MTKAYQNLLEYDENKTELVQITQPVKTRAHKTKTTKTGEPKKLSDKRGCEFCPLNNEPGINKVKNLDKVTGKPIMVWAQCPGSEENEAGKELIGPSGKFFWNHAAKVGLLRKDVDVQNVVRCLTAMGKDKYGKWILREPTKGEIHCCSLYNEQALAKSGARVHLVLGKVAAKAFLKGEWRKGQQTIYSEKMQAWVITTFHPAYFLRGAPRSKIAEFESAIRAAVKRAGMQSASKFAYIEKQDYKDVPAKDLKEQLEKPLRFAAQNGELISVDIEDDWDDGKNVIVCVGFSWQRGQARVVYLEHPESDGHQEEKLKVIREIMEDPTIQKAFQHGTYDVQKLKDLLGIKTEGYAHDTNYSEYLRFSGRHSFSLEAIADTRFKAFAGYKSILDPYRDKVTGMAPFLKVPMKIITLYNGADCDLQYRIAKSNHKEVNHSLLRAFILAAFQVADMEEHGPWFDFDHEQLLDSWLPIQTSIIKNKLIEMSQDKNFNPNSPVQVAKVVYDKLKLGKKLGDAWYESRKKKTKGNKRATDKDTMEMLSNYHKFPKLVLDYRVLTKKKGTYVDGFKNSAEKHHGRVRTKWWLTGTISGRLRSGGEKNKSKRERGIVGLQNIDGDPLIENLLVSDPKWRKAYGEWLNSVASMTS